VVAVRHPLATDEVLRILMADVAEREMTLLMSSHVPGELRAALRLGNRGAIPQNDERHADVPSPARIANRRHSGTTARSAPY